MIIYNKGRKILNHKNLFKSIGSQFSFCKVNTCIMYQYINLSLKLIQFLRHSVEYPQVAQISYFIVALDSKFIFNLLLESF